MQSKVNISSSVVEHTPESFSDLLELTAHFGVLIGQSWAQMYQENFVETRLMAIEMAKVFQNEWKGEDEDYLDDIEIFFEKYKVNEEKTNGKNSILHQKAQRGIQ
jgi:3-isopropylmalate dehydratase small subunit